MKQWVLREAIPEKISKEFELQPDLVRRLLFYRGIQTFVDAEKFLNPDYEKDLRDPFEILDMDKATDRILNAIVKNEKIIIFGDYDADGICASAIFNDFFKKINFENFHIHIPDRHLDGYGLTTKAIKEFIEQKAGLVLTLDCGITDRDEIEELNKAGINTIIIDHHLVSGEKPKAFAIVDSKQNEDKYPFKDLCGAGVVLKVIHAIINKIRDGKVIDCKINIAPGWEKWLLDLAAIATVADMVPLTGENRTIVFYGLKVLRKTNRIGLLALCRRLDLGLKNINEDDIAFLLAPRINIASRMERATISFNLMVTESVQEADWISGRLELMNGDRRSAVDKILLFASEKIDKEKDWPIVVGDAEWNPGVLGLAANRLMEKYNRPVFLWGKGGTDNIKGSCRSNGTINLVELMSVLPKGFLEDFGGHVLAGGFSMDEKKIKDLEKEILKAWEKVSKIETENNIIFIDKEISINDVNEDLYIQIEKFQPFGMNNPKPIFLFSDLEISNVKKFGNGGIHLQLDFRKSNGKDIVSAIGFFFNGNFPDFKGGYKIDLVASLEKSFFRATPELRLRIIDIKLKS